MKPLQLRLQAFGPFANSITISFDRVFDGGLFLLHGRTGAGKTSILDGLCFALFGRPSTPEREKDLRALRSDAANADCQTEVELIFTIGTAAYRIKRIPTQEVPKNGAKARPNSKEPARLKNGSAQSRHCGPAKAISGNLLPAAQRKSILTSKISLV